MRNGSLFLDDMSIGGARKWLYDLFDYHQQDDRFVAELLNSGKKLLITNICVNLKITYEII